MADLDFWNRVHFFAAPKEHRSVLRPFCYSARSDHSQESTPSVFHTSQIPEKKFHVSATEARFEIAGFYVWSRVTNLQIELRRLIELHAKANAQDVSLGPQTAHALCPRHSVTGALEAQYEKLIPKLQITSHHKYMTARASIKSFRVTFLMRRSCAGYCTTRYLLVPENEPLFVRNVHRHTPSHSFVRRC